MASIRLAVVVGVLVLVCAISLGDGLRMSNGPKKCCFEFAVQQLPRGRILEYTKTSTRCSNQGVLFRTIAGRQVCANPSDSWVQNYMKHFDRKNMKKQNL
ncbi:monocyte chemotactic protein 1B-like [Acipenser oxyrinchus oxyrinchus]|uniref:C-C motif chemokine n=1 Tax=Acipenser oxyrinchus oxyrinchus TaxID=40147 RepID=A0AAD8FYK4_ACIOX|nr:monocyte chemotactic protein 1B-like [Acipenser oxyrinchus oxyrinchus]